MYVIWSFEHRAWWCPNRCGYVESLANAGRYSAEEAGSIVTSSVFCHEIAVHEDVAEKRGAPQYHPYDGKVFP